MKPIVKTAFLTAWISCAAGASAFLATESAFAQLPVEAAPDATAPAAPTPAPAAPGAAQPAAPAAATPTAPAEPTGTDHDLFIHHFALAWYGVSDIPLGSGKPDGNNATPSIAEASFDKSVSAPALGLRYWFNQRFGIDAGVGLYFTGGSTSAANTSFAHQGKFAMLIHGGVPIAISNFQHLSFELIPEINLGFASSGVKSTSTANPPPDAALSGFRFDLGARAGAELFFGFIGVPQLSLEGSVGAFLTYQARGVSVGNQSASSSDLTITTSSFNSPWDFFRSTVAARYYF
jgi:hypothetical protein